MEAKPPRAQGLSLGPHGHSPKPGSWLRREIRGPAEAPAVTLRRCRRGGRRHLRPRALRVQGLSFQKSGARAEREGGRRPGAQTAALKGRVPASLR